MNILIQDGLSANYHIRMALARGFMISGYNVNFWNLEGKSAFDIFSEFKPDLFLGSTWQLDRAIIKCLSVRPEIPIILYGDIWEPVSSIDLNRYPVGVANDDQKRNVESLVKAGCNIKNIISNHGVADIDATHGGWRQLGLQEHSVLVSADITTFYPRTKDENYHLQLFYTGGSWEYKNRTIDQYLTPLFYPGTKNWRIRVVGGGWNCVHAVGMMSDDEVTKHYTNADIIPHMTEPHMTDGLYSDIPLRYMQVPACQGFAISCPGAGLRDIFDENELVIADNPKDFHEKIVYFLNNPDLTKSYRENSYHKVLSAHTNLHRCVELLRMIGEDCSPVMFRLDELNRSAAP